MEDTIIFVVNNMLAVAVSVSFSRLAMQRREIWRQLLATVASFPLIVLIGTLLLGSVGHLDAANLTFFLLALVTLITCISLFLKIKYRVNQETYSWDIDMNEDAPTEQALWLVAVVLVSGFFSVWMFRALFGPTIFVYDDMTYHATATAHWLLDKQISLAPNNYHAHYPFNAELVSLWFMLPFKNDSYASISGLYWLTLAVSAMLSIGAFQRHSKFAITMTIAMFLSSPVVLNQLRTFSSVDLAGAASMLAAIAFSVPSKESSKGNRLVDAMFSGSLAGFAAGCKVSFFPVVILLVLWCILKTKRSSRGTRVQVAIVFSACVTVFGGFWYIRNWILVGNPFFPAQLGPFQGPFGMEQERTTLLYWIVQNPFSPKQWLKLVYEHLRWPFGLGIVSLIGYGYIGYCLLNKGRKASFSIALLLLAVGVVAGGFYLISPFSGTDNGPDAPLRIATRFLLFPFAIGLCLSASLMDQKTQRAQLWQSISILVVATSWTVTPTNSGIVIPLLSFDYVIALLGGIGGLLCNYHFYNPALRSYILRHWALLLGGALVLSLSVLAICSNYKKNMNDHFIHNSGLPPHHIGLAWKELEKLPDSSRIGWFTGGWPKYYPLFGRRLQHVPCALKSNGSLFISTFDSWRNDGLVWWSSEPLLDGQDELVINLIQNGIDYVFIAKINNWPQQYYRLNESDLVSSLYNDTKHAIFQISPPK
jgi:hypothetical protein